MSVSHSVPTYTECPQIVFNLIFAFHNATENEHRNQHGLIARLGLEEKFIQCIDIINIPQE